MTILLFIAILVVLVLVHETGHFILAKRAGIRVDEFGLGYPPRIWGKKIGETLYSINALPFGGFVKIFGEDLEDEAKTGPDAAQSFALKPKWIQVAVLSAGIIFNLIFAWFIISGGYFAGVPASAETTLGHVANSHLEIVDVLSKSPAALAGLKSGDVITSLAAEPAGAQNKSVDTLADLSPEKVSAFVSSHQDATFRIAYDRKGVEKNITLKPAPDLAPGQKILGVSMDMIGTLKLPLYLALWEGLKTTWGMIFAIITGLATLFGNLFQGHGDFSQVAGPVGIAHLVGDARQLGWSYVLSFTAFISINLAVVNLIPFPALDGGRILFVIIEAIRRKPISAKVAGTTNFIGFAILIALMLVVTFHDVLKLFVK